MWTQELILAALCNTHLQAEKSMARIRVEQKHSVNRKENGIGKRSVGETSDF